MRVSVRTWKWIGVVLLALVVVTAVVWEWVVPAVIVRQIRAQYAGRVTIDGWWLNTRSAGVEGLELAESDAVDSPVWARAKSVAVDLTLVEVLKGRTRPRRLTIRTPEIVFRLAEDGTPLTKIPVKSGGAAGSLPEIVVERGHVTIEQGRDRELNVREIDGTLKPAVDGVTFEARAEDPSWGPWTARGAFEPGFEDGTIRFEGRNVAVSESRVTRMPFVPPEVWDHVRPKEGQAHVAVTLDLDAGGNAGGKSHRVGVQTVVDYLGTTLDLPSLDLVTRDTRGRMTVDGGLVRLKKVRGKAIDGQVVADGSLDFTMTPPRIDLGLDLQGVEVASAPPRWQLQELDLKGKLTGHAQLVVRLEENGPDLSGTTGEAVIRDGSIQDIPVKSLKLSMSAQGNELRYDTGQGSEPTARSVPHEPPTGLSAAMAEAVLIGLEEILLEQEPQPESEPRPERSAPAKGGFRLPKTLSTEIELEDVDLNKIMARAEALGLHAPIGISGKLALKARATIPLGGLKDLKQYVFHGQATLTEANIAGIDFGRIDAKLDLENGILTLSEFRGLLVEAPAGDVAHRPAAAEPVPDQGPLPAGGFRGRIEVALSPPGMLDGHFEGNALPLGELTAPVLPRPTPLSGLVTINADARAAVEHLSELTAWSGQAEARSVRISYRETTLDSVDALVKVAEGRLDVRELTARLNNQPLEAHVGLDLARPYQFEGTLKVNGWDVSSLLAFVPAVPRPSPIDGTLTASAEAKGTIQPLDVTTRGEGQLARLHAGKVPLGEVPFAWDTAGDTISLSVKDAHPFGGSLNASAHLPAKGDRPIEGSAQFQEIDTAKLAAALPNRTLEMEGRADGKAAFLIRTDAPEGVPPLEANFELAAPNLKLRGFDARKLQAVLTIRQGILNYDVLAQSLGGVFKLKGDLPLAQGAGHPLQPMPLGEGREANARLQAVRFHLDQLWQALQVSGPLGQLGGQGAIDANLRLNPAAPAGFLAHGVAEFRDLTWRKDVPVGSLRAIVLHSPRGWWIDPLTGELLGGQASGSIHALEPSDDEGGPPRVDVALRVENALLSRILELVPYIDDRKAEGVGTLEVSGRFDELLQGEALLLIDRGRVLGIPLDALRLPVEVVYVPSGSTGNLQSRGWTARLAGGQVRGNARYRLGAEPSYDGDVQITQIDLGTITRTLSRASHPAQGRVSGRIEFAGTDPADLRRLTGRIHLDLDDASLFQLPVFRQLDRFLGSAYGGVFEDGDLRAVIANRRIVVQELTLTGRVAQLYAFGTVGFNEQLDLVMLINTANIIPETGQALVAIIPGLSQSLNRREIAFQRVSNFLGGRLLKFRVTGTIGNPQVNLDPTIRVRDPAVGFFSDVFRLPGNLVGGRSSSP